MPTDDQQLVEQYCAALPTGRVAGIYGIGGARAGDNGFLKMLVERLGGQMFQPWQYRQVTQYLAQGAAEGQTLSLYGYSLGGYRAIKVANQLGKHGLQVSRLLTFDPYSFRDNAVLQLSGDNVVQVRNFYQRNPRTAGRFGWWGSNPYWGSRLVSTRAHVEQIDFTDPVPNIPPRISHLNIVRHSLAYILEEHKEC